MLSTLRGLIKTICFTLESVSLLIFFLSLTIDISQNTDYLQETVKNMSQLALLCCILLFLGLTFFARILFWSVDDGLYYAKQLLENAEAHIRTAQERNMPQEDMLALNEAFRHLCVYLKVRLIDVTLTLLFA
jgi:hypothetical protein